MERCPVCALSKDFIGRDAPILEVKEDVLDQCLFTVLPAITKACPTCKTIWTDRKPGADWETRRFRAEAA